DLLILPKLDGKHIFVRAWYLLAAENLKYSSLAAVEAWGNLGSEAIKVGGGPGLQELAAEVKTKLNLLIGRCRGVLADRHDSHLACDRTPAQNNAVLSKPIVMIHQLVLILLDFVNVGEASGARSLLRDAAGIKNTIRPGLDIWAIASVLECGGVSSEGKRA